MQNIKELDYATRLLDRPADDAYLADWTDLLRKEREEKKEKAEISIVIFCLFNEWLALPTLIFVEISPIRKILRIPHVKNQSFLGLVNLQGQLKLALALHHILGIEKTDQYAYSHLLAIRQKNTQWIFPVSGVDGIYKISMDQLQNPPVTVAKSSTNYLKGLFSWKEKVVGLIDEQSLFSSLQRIIL
jgi:chemotaxis-related protein WspD